jgi:hypothetical protein
MLSIDLVRVLRQQTNISSPVLTLLDYVITDMLCSAAKGFTLLGIRYDSVHSLVLARGATRLTLALPMMFTACLPQHSQSPTRTNRSSGLIRNSYLLDNQMIVDNSCLGLANTQDERFTPFLVTKIKGNDC